MKILNKKQVKQKIKRLAYEILENNFKENEITLAGINNNGMGFAKLIQQELKAISDLDINLTRIRLNPANPLKDEVTVESDLKELKNKVIIIVDDVANTGRTIFYAVRPLLDILPKKVEVAVLVDRKHKSFPVLVDYVGVSLATTLKENIKVKILETNDWAAFLN